MARLATAPHPLLSSRSLAHPSPTLAVLNTLKVNSHDLQVTDLKLPKYHALKPGSQVETSDLASCLEYIGDSYILEFRI